jgi:hypothetical protein
MKNKKMTKLEMMEYYQDYAIKTYLKEAFEDLTEEQLKAEKQKYIKTNMKHVDLKTAKKLYEEAHKYFNNQI